MKPSFLRPGIAMRGVAEPMHRTPAEAASALARIESWIGTPSVKVTIVPMPAAIASSSAGSTASGGTRVTLATAPGAATASAQFLNTGIPLSSSSRGLTPPAMLVPYPRIDKACARPARPVMPWTRTGARSGKNGSAMKRRNEVHRPVEVGFDPKPLARALQPVDRLVEPVAAEPRDDRYVQLRNLGEGGYEQPRDFPQMGVPGEEIDQHSADVGANRKPAHDLHQAGR